MNEYLSRKIKILSLICIICVVYIHVDPFDVDWWKTTKIQDYPFGILFLWYFIKMGITRIGVPLFFIISGYLFFRNIKEGNLFTQFKKKYISRFHSLFIPYLFWELFWIGFLLLTQLVYTALTPSSGMGFWYDFKTAILLPETSRYLSIKDIAYTITLPRPNHPFWFLKDLMILVILSPIIYFITKKGKLLPTILIFLSIFCVSIFPDILQRIVVSRFFDQAALYFCIGAYFGINKQERFLERQNSKLLAIISSTLWFGVIIFHSFADYYQICSPVIIKLSWYLFIFFGMVAIWSIYDILSDTKFSKHLYKLTKYTFFIYVFHAPMMDNYIVFVFYKIFGTTNISYFWGYIIIPIIGIALCILIAKIFQRLLPKTYAFSLGGR